MIKHIILWTIKKEFSKEQKVEIKKNAKRELENLVGKIDGLTNLTLITEGLDSSNAEMMLDSTFTSEEALKGYQNNSFHVSVANNFVRPFTDLRLCMDYNISNS